MKSMNEELKKIKKCLLSVLSILTFSLAGNAQVDTNYLYLDTLHISWIESYHLNTIVLTNGTDSLVFAGDQTIHSIAIPRSSECRIILYSDSSTIVIQNINEVMENDVRTSMWIEVRSTTESCIQGIYLDGKTGMQLMTEQFSEEWEHIHHKVEECSYFNAGPTSYDFSGILTYL